MFPNQIAFFLLFSLIFPVAGCSPHGPLKKRLLFAHPFLWLVHGNVGTSRIRVISSKEFTVTVRSWSNRSVRVAVTVSVARLPF